MAGNSLEDSIDGDLSKVGDEKSSLHLPDLSTIGDVGINTSSLNLCLASSCLSSNSKSSASFFKACPCLLSVSLSSAAIGRSIKAAWRVSFLVTLDEINSSLHTLSQPWDIVLSEFLIWLGWSWSLKLWSFDKISWPVLTSLVMSLLS